MVCGNKKEICVRQKWPSSSDIFSEPKLFEWKSFVKMYKDKYALEYTYHLLFNGEGLPARWLGYRGKRNILPL